MPDNLDRRKYLIYFILMLVVMVVFVSYALHHPEASIRMPVSILYIFYIVYIIVMLSWLIKFLKTK